jgi:hypothetical protein
MFVALGTVIYYNTNVLNTYKSRYQSQFESAEYERSYKHLETSPQPRVTDIKLAIDVDPARRGGRIKGTLAVANQTSEPIGIVRAGPSRAGRPSLELILARRPKRPVLWYLYVHTADAASTDGK